MTDATRNHLSPIEREYISFLYDSARRASPTTITISEIEEFITTPTGMRGLVAFKAMRAKTMKAINEASKPTQVGAFL